jgi:DNA-binding IclR family transcriptional regulator
MGLASKLRPLEPLGADPSSVKSLDRALAVLDSVSTADHPLSVAEVANRVGLARPTAHRLVQTLTGAGYLVQDPLSGRVSIGLSVLQLAGSLLDRNRLRLEALPHLQAMSQRTGMRSNLGVLHRGALLYLAGVEKPSLPLIYSRFGKSAPIHCCSLGKAIIAHLPRDEFDALFLGEQLEAVTPNSITSVASLAKECETIRRRGYAMDREEHYPGHYCVSVAILNSRNQPVGAIGLSSRTPESLTPEIETVRDTAEAISHRL